MIPPALLDPRVRWGNIHKPMEVREWERPPLLQYERPGYSKWPTNRTMAQVDIDENRRRIPYAGKDGDERE
jgi:hypothetical protein